MSATPFPINGFGGLNVAVDPIDLGATGAMDMLNVDLDQPGQVRARNGWALIGSAASTQAPGPMATYNDSTPAPYIVAKTDAAVTTAYTDTGTSVATTAQVASSNNGYARFGDPSNSWLFMADGTATLRRFNGSAWANVAIIFSAEHLAVMPNSNRLVVASGSRVGFSDAGVPGTFGANNFVDLRPGDGESITALVTWRDFVIAFKQSRFFVFYGESVASGGTPVFNYRTVDAGVGCARAGCAVAGGSNGVYFTNFQGVYATTGDAPRYVSRALEPWLRSASQTFGSVSSTMDIGAPVLAYHKGRLYVTDTAHTTTLVYDPALDYWLVWNLNASGMASGTYNGIELLYFGVTASKKLARWNDSGQQTDGGSAVAWSWKSGKYPLSPDSRVAITQESAVFGTGSVTLTLSTDSFADQSGSVTLGTSPTPAEGWLQKDQEGRYWQHTLSGSGPATVEQITHYVRFAKPAGIE